MGMTRTARQAGVDGLPDVVSKSQKDAMVQKEVGHGVIQRLSFLSRAGDSEWHWLSAAWFGVFSILCFHAVPLGAMVDSLV